MPIENARVVYLKCNGCHRRHAGPGMTHGQRHKGCTASPQGRLEDEKRRVKVALDAELPAVNGNSH